MTTLSALSLQGLNPPWFWITVTAVAVAVLVLTYRGIFARTGSRLTWLLLGLRLAAVLILLLALAKPIWTSESAQTHRPRIAVVVDNSQSMTLPHGRASRHARALAWLNESPTVRRLGEHADLVYFDLTGTQRSAGDLAREPSDEQSDPVRALSRVAGMRVSERLGAVLLISDGKDTTGRRDYLALQDYPLPVHAIGFAPQVTGDQPIDVAVQSAEAPQRTLVHNAVAVQALIAKDSGPAATVTLAVERTGQTLATQEVALEAGQVRKPVTVTFTPTQPGDFVFSVRAAPVAGERNTANNVRPFKLSVDADPIRVLYIEGVLRPEYTYLRHRLTNDPDVELIAFVRSANLDQASGSSVLASSDLISAERLEKIDAVLLGDFEAHMLDEATYRALHDWVEQGGGLMVLGGYRNLTPTGLPASPLADALPVLPVDESARELQQVEQPFSFALTPDGLRHPALVVTGELETDQRLWETLPQLRGVAATGGVKPGASVLARHPSGDVVLAVQAFGKGNVAVFTADTTWRWSRHARLSGAPDTMYVRFWSQMIRWLARRDLQEAGSALAISTDRAVYERGRPIHVRVRRNPAHVLPGVSPEDTAAAQVALLVRRPDGVETPVPLTQDPAMPDAWSGTYFADRGGRHELAARLIVAGSDAASEISEFVVQGSSLELDDPAPSPATLAQIARFTGGSYADIDDGAALDALVEAMPTQPTTAVQVRTSVLWNNPAVLVVFVTLVTIEWLIRRRNQLV